MRVRVLYTDIDGTLVGPRGDFFLDSGEELTLVAAEAVVTARRAGLEIVPFSGRNRDSVANVARLIGAETWIAELGGVRSYERNAEIVLDTGDYPGKDAPEPELRRAGEGLVETWPARVEEHAPWNEHRLVSYMVRGEIDLDEAARWLGDHGFGWAEITDNGVIPRSYPALDVETVRVYHLSPRGVSKRAGVAADRARRGLSREETAVIGDAVSDLECRHEVGRAFMVANAVEKDATLRALVESAGNAEVTTGAYGAGFAEAVATLLGN